MPAAVTRRIKRLMQKVHQHIAGAGCVRASEVASAFGLAYDQAYYVLKLLYLSGVVEKRGGGRTIWWCAPGAGIGMSTCMRDAACRLLSGAKSGTAALYVSRLVRLMDPKCRRAAAARSPAAGEAFYTLYEMVRDAVVMIIKAGNTTKLVVDVEKAKLALCTPPPHSRRQQTETPQPHFSNPRRRIL